MPPNFAYLKYDPWGDVFAHFSDVVVDNVFQCTFPCLWICKSKSISQSTFSLVSSRCATHTPQVGYGVTGWEATQIACFSERMGITSMNDFIL